MPASPDKHLIMWPSGVYKSRSPITYLLMIYMYQLKINHNGNDLESRRRIHVFPLPFIDASFQLVELVRDAFDIIQQALCVIECFWLAELSAEVAEGFELACFLLQLWSDFLREEGRDKVLNRCHLVTIALIKFFNALIKIIADDVFKRTCVPTSTVCL